jgi:hypothetical protein
MLIANTNVMHTSCTYECGSISEGMKERCSGILLYKGNRVGPLTVNFVLAVEEWLQCFITFSTTWR